MSMKNLKVAVTAILDVIPETVPDITRVISKSSNMFGNVAEVGANYTSDILEDQKLLLDLKKDYREIVRAESKEAVKVGDKASIKAAYKAAQEDFEDL